MNVKATDKQKIYIIEDDVNMLYALQNKFSLEKFSVNIDTGVGELEETINKIAVYKPDFITLDLILPQVDGFKVLTAIKADVTSHTVPVCIYSELDDRASREKGEKLGAEYYFSKKKLSIDEFVSKVIKILRNKQKLNK